MRTFIFILLMMFCYSCDIFFIADIATPIKANHQDSLRFSTCCGVVEFMPSYIKLKEDKIQIHLKHCFYDGEYCLYKDSVRLLMDNSLKLDSVYLMGRNKNQDSRKTKAIRQTEYQVNTNEIVFVCFDMSITKNWDGKLTILPCSYITCDGIPLITDTIRITLK